MIKVQKFPDQETMRLFVSNNADKITPGRTFVSPNNVPYLYYRRNPNVVLTTDRAPPED